MRRSVLALGLAGVLVLPSTAFASGPGEGEAEGPEPPATIVRPPPPKVIEPDPRNYAMVLGGDIVIGLGGAALVAMAVGLGIRSDALNRREALNLGDPDPEAIERQEQRTSMGTTLAIAGGAASAALFATGITLVALGYKRERERRRNLPAVYVGPRGAGLSWSLRF